MIVRDEAAIIERAIASVLPVIDRWVVVDTGSHDGTPEIIERELSDVPGEVFHRPWVNFGHNRTELLAYVREEARPGEFALCLDADMTIASVDPALKRQRPRADALHVAYEGDLAYRQPLVLRAAIPWRYEGATHEYPTADAFEAADLDELTIHHHLDGTRRPRKFEEDLALLRREMGGAPTSRSLFYFARTLSDLGRTEEAVTAYRERQKADGYAEEVFYSLLEIGRLSGDVDALAQAMEMRPDRLEPLHAMVQLFREAGRYEAAATLLRGSVWCDVEPPEGLFIDRSVWDWRLLFEASIVDFYAGELDESRRACDRLLARDDLPSVYREAVERNRGFTESEGLTPGS